MNKASILKDIFGKFKEQGDEYLYYCPKHSHHKPKLSVNFDKNCWKCWVCGWSGYDIGYLVSEYGDRGLIRRWQELDDSVNLSFFGKKFESVLKEKENKKEDKKIQLPGQYKTLVKKDYSIEDEIAANYLLEKRDFSKQDIFAWKIGYATEGKYENRVIVPSFDRYGDINFFIARSYRDEKPPYLTCSRSKGEVVFNELMVDWESDIVLVEGVFDAMRAGPNSIPVLSNHLKKSSRLFQMICKKQPDESSVYVAFDKDARKKSINLCEKLLESGVENVKFIDVAPYGDVAEMSYKEFIKKKNNALDVDFDFILQERMEDTV